MYAHNASHGRPVPKKNFFILPNGAKLVNVHDETDCVGRLCVIHNPIPETHPQAHWTLHWRSDRAMFERICPKHGVGHPATEQMEYWYAVLSEEDAEAQSIHGCCGCC